MPIVVVFGISCLIAWSANSAGRDDYQAVKQSAWTTYESNKKQTWVTYEAERSHLWANHNTERGGIWRIYRSERDLIWRVYHEEHARAWEAYRADRTRQTYDAAAKQAQEAYNKAVRQSQDVYQKAVIESRRAYGKAVKQGEDAYGCYAARAARAYAAYVAAISRGQEGRLATTEAEVAATCRGSAGPPGPSCTAPEQGHLDIAGGAPTCEQKWGYHIAKVLVVKHFVEMSRLLDTREQRALAEDDVCDRVLSFSGAFLSIYAGPDTALRIIKSYFDIPKLLPALLGSRDKEIGTILAEATIEAAKQATLETLTGAVDAKFTIPLRVLKLINDSSTAWAVYNVTRERNRLLVAQEYLLDHYKYGGNRSRVAEKYGLAQGVSRAKVIEAIAKAQVGSSWISRKIWVHSDTASTAEHYEGLISNMVTGCMGGQCRSAVTVEERKKPRVACIFK